MKTEWDKRAASFKTTNDSTVLRDLFKLIPMVAVSLVGNTGGDQEDKGCCSGERTNKNIICGITRV